VLTVVQGEALGAHRGADDRTPARGGLDDLQARAAAHLEGHHQCRGPGQPGAHVVDGAHQLDARWPAATEGGRCAAADDREAQVGNLDREGRPDLPQEALQPAQVRSVVEGTEHQKESLLAQLGGRRVEVRRVEAVLHHAGLDPRVPCLEAPGVLGAAEDVVDATLHGLILEPAPARDLEGAAHSRGRDVSRQLQVELVVVHHQGHAEVPRQGGQQARLVQVHEVEGVEGAGRAQGET